MKLESKYYIDNRNRIMEFKHFKVIQRSDTYFGVCDRFGVEITSAKTFNGALVKAKLLEKGYQMGFEVGSEW